MKRIAIVAVSVLCAGLSGVARAADAPVTFTKDVAPILYKSCVECHRPTMFAPMSLTTFDEARPWARSIKQRVVSGAMPPWGADTPHGMFKNDPYFDEWQQAIADNRAKIDSDPEIP